MVASSPGIDEVAGGIRQKKGEASANMVGKHLSLNKLAGS